MARQHGSATRRPNCESRLIHVFIVYSHFTYVVSFTLFLTIVLCHSVSLCFCLSVRLSLSLSLAYCVCVCLSLSLSLSLSPCMSLHGPLC